MAFLRGIEELRRIEWGKKYLWDIKFQDAPDPFNSFFPAVDIEEDKGELIPFQFDQYLTDFKIPHKTSNKTIRITFLDDARNTLSDWIDDWINRLILNNKNFVSTVNKASKLVTILKLDSERNELLDQDMSYWVYPVGKLTYNGSSSSDNQTYVFEFQIVGEATSKREFISNDTA